MSMEFIFWGDENILELVMLIVTQLCEYTKNHRTVQLKCELYSMQITSQSFKCKEI